MPISNNSSSAQIYAANVDGESKIYVQPPGSGTAHRLTSRTRGWEEFPALSRSGSLVAYALSDGPEAKSEVWISQINGSRAHRVSTPEQDAFMPVFGADDHTLLFAISRFTGHYSPIARPRRHEFDIMKTIVDPDAPIASVAPIELTQQHFFDLRSLSVSPDGERFLLSTSGYPIGSLIEEFDVAKPLQIKRIFQPHVPGEPSTGASFGQAAYVGDGMQIVFTAAAEGKDGNFDYSVYQMSDVTGGELVTLAQHTGMIDDLTVGNDGTIYVTAGGKRLSLVGQAHLLR
jgi:Tol biopolymer transport system component